MSDNSNEGMVETYSICVDCLMFHANGEMNPEWGDLAVQNFLAYIDQNLDDVLILGPGEQTDEFAMSSCDSCGTRLAGSRHELFVQLIDHDTVEDEYPRCVACGATMDFCPGHGEIGDPIGNAILKAHDNEDHTMCVLDCHNEATN